MWNIGAIAKSGHPRALDTIRRIMLASAAIPGAFPPTMFDVTVGWKPYQEMQVDGAYIGSDFNRKPPEPFDQATCEPCSITATSVPAVVTIGRNSCWVSP